MKFFVVFACALAVASAGNIAVLHGAQHLPLIGANGVPVDTAEVQIARANHLAHKIEAHARNGDLAWAAPIASAPVLAQSAIAGQVVSAYSAPLVAQSWAAPAVASSWASPIVGSSWASPIVAARAIAPAAYPTTAVLPASVNGVPLETPEVQAARINHYAAHVEANARNGAILLRKRRGLIAGAPIATPLVASSWSSAPVVAAPWAVAPVAQHLPIIGANGVPVDTAEVQIARAQHLAHKVEAHVRNGDLAVAAPIVSGPVVTANSALLAASWAQQGIVSAVSGPVVASAYAAPWAL